MGHLLISGDHGVSAEGLLQGEIKLDVTMDEEHPEADIHWHGDHFHNVDLNFLPGPFKRPVHSRFSALMYKAFDLGVYGMIVNTLILDYQIYNSVFSFVLQDTVMLLLMPSKPSTTVLTTLICPSATLSSLLTVLRSPGSPFLERKSQMRNSELRSWLENTRSSSTT